MSSENSTPISPPPAKTWHGPPPPIELIHHASSLQLISQGAEARVWLLVPPRSSGERNDANGHVNGGRRRSVHVGGGIQLPQLHSFSQHPSPFSTQTQMQTTGTLQCASPKVICKERFPKKYRHPQLDATLTKNRTKSEARSLIRCLRADVPCANVMAYAQWSNESDTSRESDSGGNGSNGTTDVSTTSSCLFLEYVEGCTVRRYLEQKSEEAPEAVGDANGAEPAAKRSRGDNPTPAAGPNEFYQGEPVTTVIDSHTLRVAHTIGSLVAKMHAAGVIHGDLTTSNVMIRNPTALRSVDGSGAESSWKPHLVLIDFGLATSTAMTNHKVNKDPSKTKTKINKQPHSAEGKAVDLYVLERAFLSTHPESELLVEEVWRGYQDHFMSLDCAGDDSRGNGDEADSAVNVADVGEGAHSQAAMAVLNRLKQVRMRGRKRECFG